MNFSPSYLKEVIIYERKSLNEVSRTGSTVPAHDLNRSHGLPSPLTLTPGENSFIIKISSLGSALSVRLISEKPFLKERSNNEMAFSFIFGSLFILALFHIFIFISSKNPLHLSFVFFIFSILLFQMSLTGFSRYFLPQNILGYPFSYIGSGLTGNFAVIFMCLFTYQLLSLKDRHPLFKKITFSFIFIASLISIHLMLTHSYLHVIPTRIFSMLAVLTMIVFSIILSIKKSKTALFYFFSWVPVLLGVFFLIMNLSGFMSENKLTTWALPFGTVLESLILALTIGEKLNKVTKEKMKEQKLRISAYKQIEKNFEKMKERDRVIKTYVSPTILTEVALGQDPLKYEPKNVEKAILFTDIRNYTSLTESHSLKYSFNLLNNYFSTLNSKIFNNSGEVDKLIGDAVMATFSDPRNCIKAYQEFRSEFDEVNKERVTSKKEKIGFGVGVSFGSVLSANFGSQFKLDRTIIGDEVNIASRYESLTKDYKVGLLATSCFIEKLDDYSIYRPLDFVKIKGKDKPQIIYEIFIDNPKNVQDYKRSTREEIIQIIELKRKFHFKEALLIVEKLIQNCPQHNYENTIMDPSLFTIKNKILKSIKEENNDKQAS